MSAVVLGILGCPPSSGGGGKAEVAGVSPPEGAAEGGLSVTILGENFEGGPASVYFDGEKATDVVVVSDTALTCTVPPGEIGLADVEVRSAGNTGVKAGGFEYLPGIEAKESSNLSGGNDLFSQYERIPIDFDFQGFIGEAGDVDVFHIHPPDGGKVYISLDWAASFNAGGIAAMQVEFFQGPDPSPDPDAFFGGSIIGTHDGSGPPPSIVDWMRPSFVVSGAHGPYLRITAGGDGNHSGFDSTNPYILRVEYEADATFEPAPQKDSFRTAQIISPEAGPVELTNGAAYDDDFDWYKFAVSEDGWVRIVISAAGVGTLDTSGEIAVDAKLFWSDPSDPDGNHVYSVPGATVSAVDRPGPTANVVEVTEVEAFQTYLLRLTNSDNVPLPAYDYTVTVEYGAGGLEDDEPGVLPPADTEQDAFDLNVLTADQNLTGYVFRNGDDDWFVTQGPGGGTTADIHWDLDNVIAGTNGIGLYDPDLNALGGEFALLVFDQAWFNTSGLPIVGETIGGTSFDTTLDGSNVLTVSGVTMNAGENYYIYLNALRGYAPAESYNLFIDVP